MPDSIIDPVYLPFTVEELRSHFLPTEDTEGHVRYFVESARRYREFEAAHPNRRGMPLSSLKVPCQIEKDERFWTASCLMKFFHSADPQRHFAELLTRAFGDKPPFRGQPSWAECLRGNLHLFFEVNLPSPPGYCKWLEEHVQVDFLIPYCRDAAFRKKGTVRGDLEGPTHLDAMLLNEDNGFAVCVEAKALSDIACQVSFDARRNQIARNIDVMLEANDDLAAPLSKRDPDKTLFMLLTPERFKDNRQERLYGWLLNDYCANPAALSRDLPHRQGIDWPAVAARLGWMSWEEAQRVFPGACLWLLRLSARKCGVCGADLPEPESCYRGKVCRSCDSRALNNEGAPARENSRFDDGDNPVFIDGRKCWRRYRFGGWVTMVDSSDCRSIEQFCAHSHGLEYGSTPNAQGA